MPMHLLSRITLLFTLFFCVIQTAVAQEEPEELDADRSTQSQGPVVIPQGTFQIETGVMYVHDREDDQVLQAFSDPNLMLRIGLLKRLELRLSDKILDSTIRNETSGV